jgi:hypothetical protein
MVPVPVPVTIKAVEYEYFVAAPLSYHEMLRSRSIVCGSGSNPFSFVKKPSFMLSNKFHGKKN